MPSFPTTIPALTNPTSADNLNTAGVLHDVQHANANDEIEALAAKVGVNSSTVATSLDYLGKWKKADYTIYFDGSNYYARNNRTTTIDTGPVASLDLALNPTTQTLNNNSTADQDSFSYGGAIELAHTSGGAPMVTQAVLKMYTNIAVFGNGKGTRVQAGASFPNTGTEAAPAPVFSLGSVAVPQQRLRLEGVSIDCNSRASHGIFYEHRGGGTTGGPNGGTFIGHNEVYGHTKAGMQTGVTGDGSTTNLWVFENQIRDGLTGTKCMAIYAGDGHYLWNNLLGNAAGASSTSAYALWIAAGAVQVIGGHISWNANDATHVGNANIYVADVSVSNVSVANVYCDNVQFSPALYIANGSSGNFAMNNCWVNGGSLGAANIPVFYVANGYNYFTANGNRVVGNSPAFNYSSLVRLNATSAATAIISNNRARDVDLLWEGTTAIPSVIHGNFVLGNNGSQTTYDHTAVQSLSGLSGTAATAAAALDGQYQQPFNGLQLVDTTNNRLWTRVGGSWKYVNLS